MAENYSFDLPRFQYFSLPPNIIYHLWRYPLSTNGLQKLYKSCKYFFGKKRVPIVFHGYLWEDAIANYHQDFFGKVLNHIELPQNLMYWFDNSLLLYKFYNNIYRCTIKELDMRGGKNITINEFKIITKENTIQNFFKFPSKITYPDGKVVPMDVVLENLPNLIEFKYDNEYEPHSREIFERLNQLKFWNKFRYCCFLLNNTFETFDATLLCKFIQLNVEKNCYIRFLETRNLSNLFSNTVNEKFNDGDANKPIIRF